MSSVQTIPQASRKTVLLAAVTGWVLENGVDGFSLRAVAKALGTSARMLVYHFETKEALLAAVLEQIAQRWMGGVRFAPHVRLSDQLAEMWEQHLTTTDAHGLHVVTIQLWATGLASRDPVYMPFVDILSKGWVEVLADHLRASGAGGVESEARATLCVAAIEGLLLHRISAPDLPTDAAFAAMLDVLRFWEDAAAG